MVVQAVRARVGWVIHEGRDTLAHLVARTQMPATQQAAVVHVHYPELWPDLRDRIHAADDGLPIVVTTALRDEIPGAAAVLRLPNRGRDVLPFLTAARQLQASGCSAVLKLHTKRSVGREFGREWAKEMVDDLLPDPSRASALRSALEDSTTGLVGPARSYFDLGFHWQHNGRLVDDELRRLRLTRMSVDGFFAGSMFWARLDAIAPLLHPRPWQFDRERGQFDGTRAHAVERLFSVVPAAMGRRLLSIDAEGHITKPTPRLPDWA